ncbi:hypothetical protein D8674_002434 [Pyrus ussuriensis x Pyrus communis]|uniref:Uncharacterized protein ycf23 n=1 Tax=Pyrus ussuriensis x Pyrus communis TaxID=2448454 RepID=A0A5N5FEA3_9ROSA|nr:hypothetical protein D8674_002434 [Pyrus ussuriensis x Pyrus communis]
MGKLERESEQKMVGGGKKRWLFFKRMKKESWSLRWKYLGSAFKFRPLNLQLSFYDDVVFKIVAAFEAVIISGLQNFDKENVASVIMAAEQEGATLVDIACDPELVKLAIGLTFLPVCVSSVDPAAFPAVVEAGALMVEIGNYGSFYEMGVIFTPEQILNLTKETKRILPSVTLSVTVPHTLSLPDQIKLAEMLEQEGVDIIQTERGKCNSPSKSRVLGLVEKATPTLAAAYSISRAVKIPVMCSSGLSAVTAPMAIAAGAAGVGVDSAVNYILWDLSTGNQ